ncbi:MAG: LPS ABC transporter substrate-binding protein LptA [Rhizobiaceae bacterium]|nr:LPS ABC transporter substrate-binding protein LptA [Rhizobiaceae bacterium]
MRATDIVRLLAAALLAASPVVAHAQGIGGGGEPVEIESDKLEVLDRESTAIFTGNVTLVQGDLLLRTLKLTVYYTQANAAGATAQATGATPAPAPTGAALGGSTEVERMLAEGKVYLDQRGQVVTGDRGEFEMKTGVMVVTGNEVVLTEGPNVVVGCRFTMNQNSGQSQVDSCPNSQAAGRVRMLLKPGSSQP